MTRMGYWVTYRFHAVEVNKWYTRLTHEFGIDQWPEYSDGDKETVRLLIGKVKEEYWRRMPEEQRQMVIANLTEKRRVKEEERLRLKEEKRRLKEEERLRLKEEKRRLKEEERRVKVEERLRLKEEKRRLNEEREQQLAVAALAHKLKSTIVMLYLH
uniref:Uncharacterized protein n=1 Tax=Leersia perrieri TaxID=77586 RepID=A0A0D9UZ08_9ORYZ